MNIGAYHFCDIQSWPVVDALVCFYSEGFPYLMAWRYV